LNCYQKITQGSEKTNIYIYIYIYTHNVHIYVHTQRACINDRTLVRYNDRQSAKQRILCDGNNPEVYKITVPTKQTILCNDSDF